MARILLVEDEDSVALSTRLLLEHERHIVDLCTTGSDAEALIRSVDYDVLILDWGLPDTTGLEICRSYRCSGGTAPIMFLTARNSLREKTLGLTDGADDYLTKPFDLKELVLRVTALLRRPRQKVDTVIRVADIELDWIKHTVKKSGTPVSLSPTEFQVLEFFLRRQNQCFSQEAVLANVWSMDSDATVEAVKATIKRLRQKLDPDQQFLRTLYGVGYILEPAASASSAPS
jgi:DNA-binding response OmpR family regulator